MTPGLVSFFNNLICSFSVTSESLDPSTHFSTLCLSLFTFVFSICLACSLLLCSSLFHCVLSFPLRPSCSVSLSVSLLHPTLWFFLFLFLPDYLFLSPLLYQYEYFSPHCPIRLSVCLNVYLCPSLCLPLCPSLMWWCMKDDRTIFYDLLRSDVDLSKVDHEWTSRDRRGENKGISKSQKTPWRCVSV